MKCSLLLRTLLLMTSVFATSHAVQAQQGIDLHLNLGLGAEVFRPGKPDASGSIYLTLINRTEQAIEVPAHYGDSSMRLCASTVGGATWSHLHLIRLHEGKIDSVHLEPGKSHEVLKVKWSEILDEPHDPTYPVREPMPPETVPQKTPGPETNPPDQAKKPSEWFWTWRARPAPPYTPLQRRRGGPYADAAVFWAEWEHNGQTLRSRPVLLRVKQDDEAP